MVIKVINRSGGWNDERGITWITARSSSFPSSVRMKATPEIEMEKIRAAIQMLLFYDKKKYNMTISPFPYTPTAGTGNK